MTANKTTATITDAKRNINRLWLAFSFLASLSSRTFSKEDDVPDELEVLINYALGIEF
jgi:hypothetical protein